METPQTNRYIVTIETTDDSEFQDEGTRILKSPPITASSEDAAYRTARRMIDENLNCRAKVIGIEQI